VARLAAAGFAVPPALPDPLPPVVPVDTVSFAIADADRVVAALLRAHPPGSPARWGYNVFDDGRSVIVGPPEVLDLAREVLATPPAG
jgi:hypothetical protein